MYGWKDEEKETHRIPTCRCESDIWIAGSRQCVSVTARRMVLSNSDSAAMAVRAAYTR
jgi:hypothetical protein